MLAKCAARTREGEPCGANARPGSSYCPWHDPELSQRRSEWSAKGGANRSNKARAKKDLPAEPLSNAEAHAYLSMAFRRAIVGKMDPPLLNALAGAARALVELSRAATADERLDDLERQIVELTGRRSA